MYTKLLNMLNMLNITMRAKTGYKERYVKDIKTYSIKKKIYGWEPYKNLAKD